MRAENNIAACKMKKKRAFYSPLDIEFATTVGGYSTTLLLSSLTNLMYWL